MADILENLKSAPQRLREAPEKLKEAPEKLKEVTEKLLARREEVSDRLTTRVKHLREGGEERLWELEQGALERGGDLLERVQDVPVVSRVVPTADEKRKQWLEAITTPPIADYDALNAKNAANAVRGLSRMDLLKVRRYEAAHKDRKTVYGAVDKELEKLSRQEEPLDGLE